MNRKTIILIFAIIILVLIAGTFYVLNKNGSGNNAVYGTNRNSLEEKSECEQKTGKHCIFDLCQVEEGAVPKNYNCVPGWKPTY